MYKLRMHVPCDEELAKALADEAFCTVVHVDQGVQVDTKELQPAELDSAISPTHRVLPEDARRNFSQLARGRGSPPVDELSIAPSTATFEDDEAVDADSAADSTLDVAADSAADADDDHADPSEAAATSREIEREQTPFYSGNPTGELCAGCIGFYRFKNPPGVLGLRPPSLRSNMIAMLAVPASLASSDVMSFLGGHLRYVRHMRLVRDASRPHFNCVLLQFGSPAYAERFRRDFHGRRFNSLEPEVVTAVHIAQIEFSRPEPPPAPRCHVALRLFATSLERAADGSLLPPKTHTRAPPVAPSTAGPADAGGLSAHANGRANGSADGFAQGHSGSDVGGASASVHSASPGATFNGSCGASHGDTSDRGVSSSSTDRPFRQSRVAAQLCVLKSNRRQLFSALPQPPTLSMPAAIDGDSAVPPPLLQGRRHEVTPLPLGGLLGEAVELPNCAVCLERLDPAISGIFTILCNHTFHTECLRRWRDASCPVCRHVQEDASSATLCELCSTSDSLWICLVCGHVGCGRYGCGAGVLHNDRTGHNFAMELSSQRVWDYAGDNYVHRLIQNKVDGKLVELPHPSHSGAAGDASSADVSQFDSAALEMKQRSLEDQHEAVVHEYSLLLTGQLEAQRQHFEEQLKDAKVQHALQLREAEAALAAQSESLQKDKAEMEREVRLAAKRAAAADSLISRTREELSFNVELNAQLMQNQAELREMLKQSEKREAALKEKLVDMEEQLRDMSIHFEAQIKILQEEGAAEMSGGSVLPSELKTPAARAKRKGKVRSG